MEIFLNDKPLSIDGIEENTTLLQLTDIIEDSLKGTGVTIFEVYADKKEYSPDNTDELDKIRLIEHQCIEIFTASAADMVKMGFKDADKTLEFLQSLSSEIASDLRIGSTKNAMAKYVDFLDGIEWLLTMLKNAYRAFAANMSESSVVLDKESLVKRLTEQTEQIRSGQEEQDWVGLADALEYEFPDIFSESKELIHKIAGAE